MEAKMPKRKSKKTCDQKYPLNRLIEIKDALEKRVWAAKEKQFHTQLQREELGRKLEELQQERLFLTERLSEAKQGEVFARQKERQIEAEFHRLLDERRHCEPGLLLHRSLNLGRELFKILLRDLAIEKTARKTWYNSAFRFSETLKQKTAERNELQARVLNVQRNCEVDLEQKRHVYDDSGDLKNRNESLNAQIAMLKEWHSSLEMQIAAVRAALDQKRHLLADDKSHNERDTGARVDETMFIDENNPVNTSPEGVTIFSPKTSPTPSVFSDFKVIASPSSKFEDLNVDVIIDKSKVCALRNDIDCDPVFGRRTTFKTFVNAKPCDPRPSISLDCLAIMSSSTLTTSTKCTKDALTAATSPSSATSSVENIKFIPNDEDEIPVEAHFSKLKPTFFEPPNKTSLSSTSKNPKLDLIHDEMALNVLSKTNSHENNFVAPKNHLFWNTSENKDEKNRKLKLDAEETMKALMTSPIKKSIQALSPTPKENALDSDLNENSAHLSKTSSVETNACPEPNKTVSSLVSTTSATSKSSDCAQINTESNKHLSNIILTKMMPSPETKKPIANSITSVVNSASTTSVTSSSVKSVASSWDLNASFTTIKMTANSVTSSPSSTGTTETAEAMKLTNVSTSSSEFSFDETSELSSTIEKLPFDDIISKLEHLKMPKTTKKHLPSPTPEKPENGLTQIWYEILPEEVVPFSKTLIASSEYVSSDHEDETSLTESNSHATDCSCHRY